MELRSLTCLCAFALTFRLSLSQPSPAGGFAGDPKVRGVNLGGWLVVEGWIKPSLFAGIPNGDMLDGTQVQLMSLTMQTFVSAQNGGGTAVTVDRATASAWETFKLWRVSSSEFRLRTVGGQFLFCESGGCVVNTSDTGGIFVVERNVDNRIHLRLPSGSYLQAASGEKLTADYPGRPDWNANAATFQMIIAANNLHGDYQLANGYGYADAKEVLREHRSSFVTAEDFDFLARNGINTVRIPVGWWIAFDPEPPSPFVGGSLEALDSAFTWAQERGMKCIIDLHAAPNSQNGMEHSASRDGTVGWPTSSDQIDLTLSVIDFLASRYTRHPALLGIELLNEPSASLVPLEVLLAYYKQGYQVVRKHSSTAYVIVCQRIGSADPLELYQADIGAHNLVVDLHFYNMFDEYFDNMNAASNTQYVYSNRRRQLQSLLAANGPLVFIGEWVNEWNVSNASQEEYQSFGSAQLDVYNAASFGWAYWTLKCDKKHWDFVWNVKYGYLQLGQQTGHSSMKKTPRVLWWLAAIPLFL